MTTNGDARRLGGGAAGEHRSAAEAAPRGRARLALTREQIDAVSDRVYALLLEELRLDAERTGSRVQRPWSPRGGR